MTAAPNLFDDDPTPPPTGPGSRDVDLFDLDHTPALEFQQPQVPHDQQAQLAPRHAAHKAVHPQPDKADAPMVLSGHDIRVKEFRRSLLRGYSRNDVDGFLTDVIKSFDACERTLLDAQPVQSTSQPNQAPVQTTPAPQPTIPAPESAPEQSLLILKHAQRAVKDALEEAHQSAEEIRATAQTAADQVLRTATDQAQAIREDTLQVARADAERGLLRARERARDVLQLAADREQQAARAEAETELRLAHIEQRLADKANTVREHARQLDALAAWLAEQDLRPEDPSATGAVAAHAATPTLPVDGDVLAFKR